MADTISSSDELAALCREHAQTLANALRLGGDENLRIEVARPLPWDAEFRPLALHGPGALLTTGPAEAACLWLIPFDAIPIDWMSISNADQKERLRGAAVEIAGALFGSDAHSSAGQIESLVGVLDTARGFPSAGLVELTLFAADSPDAARGRIVVAGPAEITGDLFAPADSLAGNAERLDGSGSPDELPGDAFGPWSETRTRVSGRNSAHDDRLASLPPEAGRLLKLPVTVVVQLAEKKIEMRQLLSMSVGTLIMFDKDCEAPLDLYVNNRLYCQGEAVKIGEKFGLKIDRVGVRANREERILYG